MSTWKVTSPKWLVHFVWKYSLDFRQNMKKNVKYFNHFDYVLKWYFEHIRLNINDIIKVNFTCLFWLFYMCRGFPHSSISKESACKAGDHRQHRRHGSGSSPGGGNGNPLQYACLRNPMDRGAWWAKVHGVAKHRTWLSNQATATVSNLRWHMWRSLHFNWLAFVHTVCLKVSSQSNPWGLLKNSRQYRITLKSKCQNLNQGRLGP